MNKVLCICAALALTFSAATALAADVTGAWTSTAQTPNGDGFQLTFTFRQDGASLTGTVQGPQGDPIAISNGKIDGDKFTFDVSFNGMTIHHDCTVDGDQIKMTTKSDSGDFPRDGNDVEAGQGHAFGSGSARSRTQVDTCAFPALRASCRGFQNRLLRQRGKVFAPPRPIGRFRRIRVVSMEFASLSSAPHPAF